MLRETSASCQPRAASARATEALMPLPVPTITATFAGLLESVMGIVLFEVSNGWRGVRPGFADTI